VSIKLINYHERYGPAGLPLPLTAAHKTNRRCVANTNIAELALASDSHAETIVNICTQKSEGLQNIHYVTLTTKLQEIAN
jgi:hypothetical protein